MTKNELEEFMLSFYHRALTDALVQKGMTLALLHMMQKEISNESSSRKFLTAFEKLSQMLAGRFYNSQIAINYESEDFDSRVINDINNEISLTLTQLADEEEAGTGLN